eukprot:Rhum_TRINITY_DN8696_c0_g1::Rhum_TRINITY_DN8696_c0_g1_i1::g.29397::m.29397
MGEKGRTSCCLPPPLRRSGALFEKRENDGVPEVALHRLEVVDGAQGFVHHQHGLRRLLEGLPLRHGGRVHVIRRRHVVEVRHEVVRQLLALARVDPVRRVEHHRQLAAVRHADQVLVDAVVRREEVRVRLRSPLQEVHVHARHRLRGVGAVLRQKVPRRAPRRARVLAVRVRLRGGAPATELVARDAGVQLEDGVGGLLRVHARVLQPLLVTLLRPRVRVRVGDHGLALVLVQAEDHRGQLVELLVRRQTLRRVRQHHAVHGGAPDAVPVRRVHRLAQTRQTLAAQARELRGSGRLLAPRRGGELVEVRVRVRLARRVVVRARLHRRRGEERPGAGHHHEARHHRGTRRLAEDEDAAAVAAEQVRVLAHPPQRVLRVLQAEVARRAVGRLRRHGVAAEPAHGAETVVEGDEHRPVLLTGHPPALVQRVHRPVVAAAAACGERASVDEHENG